MKKPVALALAPLLALSLAACSSEEKDASKEEVIAGLQKIVAPTLVEQTTEEGGELDADVFNSEVVKPYVECTVDKAYDSLSASTHNELAKGAHQDIDTLKIAKDDAELLQKDLEDCLDTFNDARQKVFDDGRLFVEE